MRIVFDQKIETWLRCHAEAFAEFGGVPKGKVESVVKYVKNNFFAARPELLDVVEIRAELRRWLDRIANVRIHGTS